MAKILISGGSGLVGTALTRRLLEEGHEVRWLSRKEGTWNGVKKFFWDPAGGLIDENALNGVQHIVHLAGAGIFDKRWTQRYKQMIVGSRVRSAELLYNQVRKNNLTPESFTGASAVGYYGVSVGGPARKEEDKSGHDFLAKVCVAWENAYAPFRQAGIRTNIIRTAVVLDREDGALPKLAMPFRFGFGAALGSGSQAFPWIHLDDLVKVYVRSISNAGMNGVYNAAAPGHVSNRQFSAILAKTLHRPFWLPRVPSWVLKMMIGEASSALVSGIDASSVKLSECGFQFEFTELEPALEDLLLR